MYLETGTTLISASGGLETAKEYKGNGCTTFTYALIKALEQKEADADEEGETTVTKWQACLKKEVPRLKDGD